MDAHPASHPTDQTLSSYSLDKLDDAAVTNDHQTPDNKRRFQHRAGSREDHTPHRPRSCRTQDPCPNQQSPSHRFRPPNVPAR